MNTINYTLIAFMVVTPLAVLLHAAYKEAKEEDLAMTQAKAMIRNTPATGTVRVLHTTPIYDWANPVEQVDYNALMVECPADPYAMYRGMSMEALVDRAMQCPDTDIFNYIDLINKESK